MTAPAPQEKLHQMGIPRYPDPALNPKSPNPEPYNPETLTWELSAEAPTPFVVELVAEEWSWKLSVSRSNEAGVQGLFRVAEGTGRPPTVVSSSGGLAYFRASDLVNP